jgi:hypothetical protein
MVMPGIVVGVLKGTMKPVVDGIVCGVPRPKSESAVPDTMSVAPGATKMNTDTFGAGLTPQGVGNMSKGKGAKGKSY